MAQEKGALKPGVHTNDFAPIHGLRALKLGHASLATVFRPGRLTLQPILRENLASPVLRYQPITTAVVTDACLNTRWHHGAYTSAVLRESLGLDRVVTVSAQWTLNCRDPIGSRQFSRVVNRCSREYVRRALATWVVLIIYAVRQHRLNASPAASFFFRCTHIVRETFRSIFN